MSQHTLALFLAFVACSSISLSLLVLSHLPFMRRLNVECWAALLTFLGKKTRVPLAASVLDTATTWLGFLWGLSLIPLCIGLYADVFGIFGRGYTPVFFGISLMLMLHSCLICLILALVRWLILRRREQA